LLVRPPATAALTTICYRLGDLACGLSAEAQGWSAEQREAAVVSVRCAWNRSQAPGVSAEELFGLVRELADYGASAWEARHQAFE
jgi:hypothetical protein